MIIIDSSFWLEYYADSEYAMHINHAVENMEETIIPTIIISEVFKKLLVIADEKTAISFIAQMKKGVLSELDFDLALNSAYYGKKYKLPLADSIIYATAMKYNAELYTMDKHFDGLENVVYYAKS